MYVKIAYKGDLCRSECPFLGLPGDPKPTRPGRCNLFETYLAPLRDGTFVRCAPCRREATIDMTVPITKKAQPAYVMVAGTIYTHISKIDSAKFTGRHISFLGSIYVEMLSGAAARAKMMEEAAAELEAAKVDPPLVPVLMLDGQENDLPSEVEAPHVQYLVLDLES